MTAPQHRPWHDDITDAARHVLKPGWSCIVTLRTAGDCLAAPERGPDYPLHIAALNA